MLTSSKWSLCLDVAIATLAFAALRPAPAPAPAAADRGTCLLLTGANSAIREPRVELVSAPEEWARLWLEHRGSPPVERYDSFLNKAGLPVVDFATHVVVAVFVGETANIAGLRVEGEASDAGAAAADHTTLRYASNSYQTLGEAEPARPFGFFVLPSGDRPLVVEEQLYSMTGPSRVEARARFEPPR